MRNLILIVLFFLAFPPANAFAAVTVLKTNVNGPQPPDSEIAEAVRTHIDTDKYREVRVQVIRGDGGEPSHYLIYLLSKSSHRVDFARINVDQHYNVLSVQLNYVPQNTDLEQQPGEADGPTRSP